MSILYICSNENLSFQYIEKYAFPTDQLSIILYSDRSMVPTLLRLLMHVDEIISYTIDRATFSGGCWSPNQALLGHISKGSANNFQASYVIKIITNRLRLSSDTLLSFYPLQRNETKLFSNADAFAFSLHENLKEFQHKKMTMDMLNLSMIIRLTNMYK